MRALKRFSRSSYALRCSAVIMPSSVFRPSARTESITGRMERITSAVRQFMSSSTESIFTRCSVEMPMSSYIWTRAETRAGFFEMTRSAEKPSTPPTSTAPSRNMSACCLERCMRISLFGNNEPERIVARLRSRTLNRRSLDGGARDRGRREQLLIRGLGGRLLGAEHRNPRGDDEDGGGDQRRAQPAIELGPPPQLDLGHARHD